MTKAKKLMCEKAMQQIAQAKLMSDFYMDLSAKEEDQKKSAEWEQKAQQSQDSQRINIDFLEFYS